MQTNHPAQTPRDLRAEAAEHRRRGDIAAAIVAEIDAAMVARSICGQEAARA